MKRSKNLLLVFGVIFAILAVITISTVAFADVGQQEEITKIAEVVYDDGKVTVEEIYGDSKAVAGEVYKDAKLVAGEVYQDTKGATGTVYGDAKLVISELYDDAKSAVGAIAEALGTTAEYVWPILVKQKIVDSIAYSLSLLLIFISGALLLRAGYLGDTKWDWDDNEAFTACTIGALLLAGSLIALVFLSKEIAMGFINPEYGAIMDILDLIK